MVDLLSGNRFLVVAGIGSSAMALGAAGLLAFGPHHDTASTVVPVVATTPAPAPAPAGAPVADPGCWMFCNEPPAPPANADGCRLFCDLQRPAGGGAR